MSKIVFYSKVVLAATILSADFLHAASTRAITSLSNDPNTIGTLPYWILNGSIGDVLDCSPIAGQTITLTSSLPAITQSYTINGSGITLDGAHLYQAFQIAAGQVILNDITIQNALSKGGDGGNGYSGGGGGVGGGGAIYLHGSTSLTLNASSLLHNTAQGGQGGYASSFLGNAGAGGGGGFGGGDGGSTFESVSTGGGGGGHNHGGNGGPDLSLNGDNGIYFGGGGGGAGLNSMAAGGDGGNASPTGSFMGGSQAAGNGGGGAGNSQNGFSATGSASAGIPGSGGSGIGIDLLFGAGGGGGAASETGFPAGTGVGAGGGGGGSNYSGGNGGVLGGGGGGGIGGVGGNGGFGAGGGGAATGGIGGGGFNAGGGNGASTGSGAGGGGGGSGLGGAIFIQNGAQLFIIDAQAISGNMAIAGLGGSSTDTDNASDGLALGQDIFMREQGFIHFNLSNTLTLASPIEGDQTEGANTSGGLYKTGKGTLSLNGANTYSGLTHIDQGTLNLNGSVIGSVIIGPGASLSGNATIAGTLTSSGIISPGNSIGTIYAADLLLNSSSQLRIEVSASGANDLIAITDTAQLAGNLTISPLPGNYNSATTYTILTAASHETGSFSTIETSRASLVQLFYEPSSIQAEVLPLMSLNLYPNARAAGVNYLADGFKTGSDAQNVNKALLTLSPAGLNQALNQMQAAPFSALAWTQAQNGLLIRSSYLQHLDNVPLNTHQCNGLHLWLDFSGAWQRQLNRAEQIGYGVGTGAITLGVDATCRPHFKCGVAASYSYSALNWKQNSSKANLNSAYGGFYAHWFNERAYLKATLLGAYTHYQANRRLHFATLNRLAQSSHNGGELSTGIETGLPYNLHPSNTLTPFIRVDYLYLFQQGFVEKGAKSLNLNVNSQQNQLLQTEVGLMWKGAYVTEALATFSPSIKLSYINDASLTSRRIRARFRDSTTSYTVQGLSLSRNLGAISAAMSYFNKGDRLGLIACYEGQFSSTYYNQIASLKLEIKF